MSAWEAKIDTCKISIHKISQMDSPALVTCADLNSRQQKAAPLAGIIDIKVNVLLQMLRVHT